MSLRYFSKGGARPEEPPKKYRKTTIVPMWKMEEGFLCESREGNLVGHAGDFLAEDSHGGFYPISAEFHAANYEEVT